MCGGSAISSLPDYNRGIAIVIPSCKQRIAIRLGLKLSHGLQLYLHDYLKTVNQELLSIWC